MLNECSDIEDLLVCGSCQKNFPLGNIVNFVQHKKFDCSDVSIAGKCKLLVVLKSFLIYNTGCVSLQCLWCCCHCVSLLH